MASIKAALGATFTLGHGPEPVPALVTGTTMVFLHSHVFEDDADFPVTRFTYWVNVRDSARNTERQLAAGRRVFDTSRAEGRTQSQPEGR